MSAPAVFRLSPWRFGLGVALVVAPMLLLVRGAFVVALLAADVSLGPWELVESMPMALLPLVPAVVGSVAVARRQPSWVRVSGSGLEFSTSGCRAAFLPWAAVESVRLRWAGPWTQLVVTPTGPDVASFAWVPGRVPRLRRGSFVITVGPMTPGPAALLAEVQHRHAAQPTN